jgi:hypothetical protein
VTAAAGAALGAAIVIGCGVALLAAVRGGRRTPTYPHVNGDWYTAADLERLNRRIREAAAADLERLDRLALDSLPPIDPRDADLWARQILGAEPGRIIDEARKHNPEGQA